MAAVPVTIVGTITTAAPKSGGEVDPSGTQQCVITGIATITGLEVGGGPIIPPDQQPPGKPPGIWGGGNVPMPSPPIANVPGAPGYNPPDKPPEPITPPIDWKAVWAGPENGWVVVGVPQFPHPAPGKTPPATPPKP